MSKKVFEGLKANMLEAIAFAQDETKARVHTVEVPLVNVKAARQNLHMSQDEFATVLCIPVSTLRKWEQGQRCPDAATRLLLQIIVHEPKAAEKTLTTLVREGTIASTALGKNAAARRRRRIAPK
ncbi:MAG: helix-turn-helix domain-containing protein [Xanthobacteraceae bacterium]